MNKFNFGWYQRIPKDSHISTGVADLTAEVDKNIQGLIDAGDAFSKRPVAFGTFMRKFSGNFGCKRFATKDEIAAAQYLVRTVVQNNQVKSYTVYVSGSWIRIDFISGAPAWAMETIRKFLIRKKLVYDNKPYQWSQPIGRTSAHPYLALGPRTVNFTGRRQNTYTSIGFIGK